MKKISSFLLYSILFFHGLTSIASNEVKEVRLMLKNLFPNQQVSQEKKVRIIAKNIYFDYHNGGQIVFFPLEKGEYLFFKKIKKINFKSLLTKKEKSFFKRYEI